MSGQQFQRVLWVQLLAAAFQPAAQVSGQLCLLWPLFRELPAPELPEDFSLVLAQPFRRVLWFQLLFLLLLLLLLSLLLVDFPPVTEERPKQCWFRKWLPK